MSEIKFVEYKGVQYKVHNRLGHRNFLSIEFVELEDITEIKGLDKLKNLEELILEGNNIQKIE